jgi:hypothetical protein
MLRRGLDPPVQEEEPEHPLFGPTAQARLRAIEDSPVWHYLRAAIGETREALFQSKPISTEDLWRTWGAIEALTTLLHTGPSSVLQYSELAASVSQDEKGSGEREYVPTVHRFEG